MVPRVKLGRGRFLICVSEEEELGDFKILQKKHWIRVLEMVCLMKKVMVELSHDETSSLFRIKLLSNSNPVTLWSYQLTWFCSS